MSFERIRPVIVENFPLTIGEVARQYWKLPENCPNTLFHYTTLTGMEGILNCGGLRATYRMNMSDKGEFEYPKKIIYETTHEIEQLCDVPPVALSLAQYTRLNLERTLRDSKDESRSYCACLTLESDHLKMWDFYAEKGKGVAIGINFSRFLWLQMEREKSGIPSIMPAPVTYDEFKQRTLTRLLVEAGIDDMRRFNQSTSNKSADLTALRDRVMEEIIVHLMVLIDYFKSPSYASEREVRLMLHSRDSTFMAQNIKYYQRDSVAIPYILFDFRNIESGLIPISEIKIGPNADTLTMRRKIGDLLLELGYGKSNKDWPQITQSRLTAQ